MENGVPERFDRLPRHAAIAARLNESDRGHERDVDFPLVEQFGDGEKSGFGVERVENRLDQKKIGAAIDQAARLLVVGIDQLLIRNPARRRAVHVGGDRTSPIGRPHRPGNKARARRIFSHDELDSIFSGFCAGKVQVVDELLQPVVRHEHGFQ